MNPDPKFQTAIAQQVIWKNPAIRRFAISLVRHALEQSDRFTTDIVPDADRLDDHGQPLGTGIAGSVIELLKNANLIQPVGHTGMDGAWYALRKKSNRPDRKGAWVCVYRLSNPALARSFLERHGGETVAVPRQAELAV